MEISNDIISIGGLVVSIMVWIFIIQVGIRMHRPRILIAGILSVVAYAVNIIFISVEAFISDNFIKFFENMGISFTTSFLIIEFLIYIIPTTIIGVLIPVVLILDAKENKMPIVFPAVALALEISLLGLYPLYIGLELMGIMISFSIPVISAVPIMYAIYYMMVKRNSVSNEIELKKEIVNYDSEYL